MTSRLCPPIFNYRNTGSVLPIRDFMLLRVAMWFPNPSVYGDPTVLYETSVAMLSTAAAKHNHHRHTTKASVTSAGAGRHFRWCPSQI